MRFREAQLHVEASEQPSDTQGPDPLNDPKFRVPRRVICVPLLTEAPLMSPDPLRGVDIRAGMEL